jgi:hypothetical protein
MSRIFLNSIKNILKGDKVQKVSRGKSRISRPPDKLTGAQLENLIWGFNILDWDQDAFRDEAHRREMWGEHKKHIMSLQGKPCNGESFLLSKGKVYFGLGERPAAWWLYDAPELRRLINCNLKEQCELSPCRIKAGGFHEGDDPPPCVIRNPGSEVLRNSQCGLHRKGKWDVYVDSKHLPSSESERAYLTRLSLLSELEKAEECGSKSSKSDAKKPRN